MSDQKKSVSPGSGSAAWLVRHYLQWQVEVGQRRTQSAFARWLGLTRNSVSQLMSGRRQPGYRVACLLADHFDDASIFAALGQAAPELTVCRWQARLWRGWTPSEAAVRALTTLLESEARLENTHQG